MKSDFRQPFIDILVKLTQKDDKIILIVSDVGFSYIEKFQKKFPRRFLNLGVTEQTTLIVSAGLALSGFKPYVYSMINFVTMRPYEMLRNAICYHNANVKLIGVKGSEKYKFLGFSHNIEDDEDIKILSHLPNLKIFIPQNTDETKKAILDSYKRKGPAYIRL